MERDELKRKLKNRNCFNCIYLTEIDKENNTGMCMYINYTFSPIKDIHNYSCDNWFNNNEI